MHPGESLVRSPLVRSYSIDYKSSCHSDSGCDARQQSPHLLLSINILEPKAWNVSYLRPICDLSPPLITPLTFSDKLWLAPWPELRCNQIGIFFYVPYLYFPLSLISIGAASLHEDSRVHGPAGTPSIAGMWPHVSDMWLSPPSSSNIIYRLGCQLSDWWQLSDHCCVCGF